MSDNPGDVGWAPAPGRRGRRAARNAGTGTDNHAQANPNAQASNNARASEIAQTQNNAQTQDIAQAQNIAQAVPAPVPSHGNVRVSAWDNGPPAFGRINPTALAFTPGGTAPRPSFPTQTPSASMPTSVRQQQQQSGSAGTGGQHLVRMPLGPVTTNTNRPSPFSSSRGPRPPNRPMPYASAAAGLSGTQSVAYRPSQPQDQATRPGVSTGSQVSRDVLNASRFAAAPQNTQTMAIELLKAQNAAPLSEDERNELLVQIINREGLRPGFANNGNGFDVFTNYVELTPPKEIYVYELAMIRSSLTRQPVLVCKQADKDAIMDVVGNLVNELVQSNGWVTDGDLIWSTTDIFGMTLASPPRIVSSDPDDPNGGLRYLNECGQTLHIETCQIRFKCKIDLQNVNNRIAQIMQVPPGTSWKQSEPGILLRGLNAMITHSARQNPGLTWKGANKAFQNRPARPLSDCPLAHSLNGFFLSARPGMNGLLVNINPATSPFRGRGTVQEYIDGHPREVGSQLTAALKGMKVFINYKTRGAFNPAQTRYRFILEITDTRIDHQPCADPLAVDPNVLHFYNNNHSHLLSLHNDPVSLREINNLVSGNQYMRAVRVAKSSRATPHPWEYFPASMLTIDGFQPLHAELSNTQTANMIEHARHSPRENYNLIRTEGLGMFSLRNVGQGGLLQFGNMSTGTTLLTVPADTLNAPTVQYLLRDRSGQVRSPAIDNGKWNLRDVSLTPTAHISQLPFVNLSSYGTNDAPLRNLFDKMQTQLAFHGLLAQGVQYMPMHTGPAPIPDHTPESEGNVFQYFGNSVLRKLDPMATILIILKVKDYNAYACLKRVAELKLGTNTVLVDGAKQTMRGRGRDDFAFSLQTASNIALKYNLKGGQTNHTLGHEAFDLLRAASGPKKADTIVIGADVTHPPHNGSPGTPSIAAVVGSTDDDFMHFPGSMRLQRGKEEDIVELGDLVKERLIDWAEAHNDRLPARMLFYRDGVSESQYEKLRTYEIPQIQKAFNWAQEYLSWKRNHPQDQVMDPKRNPWPPAAQTPKDTDDHEYADDTRVKVAFDLTYIVVGKRHNTRFYAINDKDRISADRNRRGCNENLKPGLIVDQRVTHPYSFDFYLQAHNPIIGTGRPAHYIVLQNDMGLDVSAIQNIVSPPSFVAVLVLELTTSPTHAFSYTYARATTAVSYCAPAYYADRLCDRGRAYLRHWIKGYIGANDLGMRTRRNDETSRDYAQYISNNLRDQTYWRSHALQTPRPLKYGFARRNPWHVNMDNIMFYL